MWPICVSTETAIKIEHSDKGIKFIGPFCKKLEQQLSDRQFYFLFFGKSFVFMKKGGLKNEQNVTNNLLVVPDVYIQP
jgi:hypothetical protein